MRDEVKQPVLVSWSGGKDCSLALKRTLAQDAHRITLFATVTDGFDRVSMHGVREELIDIQARTLGLPLLKARIPQSCPGETYASIMERHMREQYAAGVRSIVFGDIFLEDVRRYRDENLARVSMTGIYPLWGKPSRELARQFLGEGFRAVVVCVDTQVLDARFCGRYYDETFLADLPAGIDPCGENGEFHTFAFDGPIFGSPMAFRKGEIVLRDAPGSGAADSAHGGSASGVAESAYNGTGRFAYCDLLPG
jgi:uncharacterized protein (TIGR00290 family)